MTREEALEVAMQNRVSVLLNNKKDMFVGYDRLINEIGTFEGYRILIVPMIAEQSEITTGVTVDKTNALINLGEMLVNTSLKAVVYANDINNQALADVFTITASSFRSLSQTNKLVIAQGFLDALVANAAALAAYKIGSDVIAAIGDSIGSCKVQVVAPGSNKSRKKTATAGIKKTIKATNDSLAIIDGLITSEYGKTDPDFVTEYFNNRMVDVQGIRHTGLTATFTDAATGKVIENAVITITSLSKSALSNIDGVAAIDKIRAGKYHITFSATGYTAQMQDVKIARGKTVEYAIVMVVA